MKVPELKEAIGSNVLTMFVLRAQKEDRGAADARP
jgi:hypothetical protein